MQAAGSAKVFFWRTGETSKSQPAQEKDKKIWYGSTNKVAPESASAGADPKNAPARLTPKGLLESEGLGGWIKAKDLSIDFFISSNAYAAQQTMEKALNPDVYVIDPDLREVDLGDLQAKSPLEIKELFALYNPKEPIPDDANECLNKAWPKIESLPEIKFEPYKTVFGTRIIGAVRKVASVYKNKTVGCSSHCEDMRDVLMASRGTAHFFTTAFGKKLIEVSDSIKDQPIGEVINRPMFKPGYGACLLLEVQENGEIYVDDSYNMEFRGVKKS